ncbi:MAG: hypothetical protein JNL54_12255 [Kineosporiaceae bacterium]|nr:hypothetical protein [Kineosporiaceae bacterium]
MAASGKDTVPESTGSRRRTKSAVRGSLDRLPSGSYRVRVNAGTDPLTGRQNTLVEVRETRQEAEKARTRLPA